jgi:three-Cys-motif partner protein
LLKHKAIDLWLLFPLGVAVNRLLKKDAKIPEAWRKILDTMFGTTDWYEVFYKTEQVRGLFENEIITHKMGDFDSISQYFVNRFKTVFAGVAEKPLPLINSRNVPLYLLCFASGNPKGAPIALRIAKHILRR